MNTIVNEKIVVMDFPIAKNPSRETVVQLILDAKDRIKETFKNNEYLLLDLGNQEIIGLKSTSFLGKIPVNDLMALKTVISDDERYKRSKMLDLGNVNVIYDHFWP